MCTLNKALLRAAMFLLLFLPALYGQANQKCRAIILTDIEADPDDTQSMIRLLLYSNEIEIKGLIATTSIHQRSNVYPESIRRLIRAYAKVQANLLRHAAGYPEADSLLQLVKQGLPVYGLQGVGVGQDSPGSDWIIKELDENDQRPLWVCVWGGPNTLAQALYKIEKNRSKNEVKRLLAQLRVYTISDQDDSGLWIRKNFPDLFYIVSPGGYENSTWGAIHQFVQGINNQTVSNSWLAHNIQQGHGPLGALYPDVGYGMEGDTPSFLSLIPNGLNVPERPDWGGWGGRYERYIPGYASFNFGFTGGVPIEPESREIWSNAIDKYEPYQISEYGRAVQKDTVTFTGNRVTLWRWRDDIQNDFAARMDWCIKSYPMANHPPVPVLAHPEQITVQSGSGFWLDAGGTHDPDGDNLSYLWFHYPEPGSFKKEIKIASAENLYRVFLLAPEVDKTEIAHFILRVTDKGDPPLSRYKRVLVTIEPKSR